MRALRIGAVLLVLALLVGDRVGAVVAGRVIATRLQAAGSLSSRPDVDIRGFPFLTQAAAGRYDRIELTAQDLQRRSIDLDSLQVQVRGARVGLGDALGGRVDSVPVESLTAKAVVGFHALEQRSKLLGVTITAAGHQVTLTGKARVAGLTVSVRTVCRVFLEGARLVVSPRMIDVDPTSKATISAVLPLLEVRVDIGTLPYGLRLTGLMVSDEGIVLSAKTGPTVLQKP